MELTIDGCWGCPIELTNVLTIMCSGTILMLLSFICSLRRFPLSKQLNKVFFALGALVYAWLVGANLRIGIRWPGDYGCWYAGHMAAIAGSVLLVGWYAFTIAVLLILRLATKKGA